MSITLIMKQENERTFHNNSKCVVDATRNKFKPKTIATSMKNAPLTAKVNSTWGNVLNKNKDATVGKISSSNKFEMNLAKNDPVKTLRFFVIELKNKIDVLLPGNRAVKNIMDNIIKTVSKMEQPLKSQNALKKLKPINSRISKPPLTENMKDVGIDELRQKVEQLDVNLKENIEENLKLKKERDGKDSQLLLLKCELDSSKQRVEKLESTLNESVNTERQTIANYEQQCKRLQNEIKTLRDTASRKEYSDTSAVNPQQELNRLVALDKFKYQMQMAFRDLEKEKLLTILKYDDIRMNASHSEFSNIYELIQKYFSSDNNQQIETMCNSQSDKNKKKCYCTDRTRNF